MIFKLEKCRETTKRSGMTIEGAMRRTTLKMEEIKINLGRSDLLKKWILRHKIRLCREPREEAVKIGKVVFNGYMREDFVPRPTRFEKEKTKVF